MALTDALLLDAAPFNAWISLRTDGIKGCGTAPTDPYDGSTQAKFDGVMNLFASLSNVTIHIGPGVFETRGYSDLFYVDFGTDNTLFFVGFQVKTRQKIRGSGMGLTTLKLVHALDPFAQTQVLGNDGANAVRYFEASDFTIDCNLPGQPVPAEAGFAGVTCGAVVVSGAYNRLHRLRAIRFGTQAPPECFVLFLTTAYFDQTGEGTVPVHNIIENCVVEQPSENNTHETSLLGSGGRRLCQRRLPRRAEQLFGLSLCQTGRHPHIQ